MENPPRVSVVMRTCDRPRFLKRSMQSLVAQSYSDFELVLVGKAECLAEAKSIRAEVVREKFSVVFCEVSEGESLGGLLNRGIEAASGDYILPFDDDDTLEPECLQVLVTNLDAALELKGFEGAVCRSYLVEEEVTEDGEIREISRNEFNNDLEQVVITDILAVNQFTIHSFMYTRETWKSLGGYNEDLAVAEDWDFNLRFVLEHDVVVVPRALNSYCIRKNAVKVSEGNTQTLGLTLHRNVATSELNRRIRNYLVDGDRVGELTAQALIGMRQENKLKKLRSLVKKVGRKVGRIDSRTEFLKAETKRLLSERARQRKPWYKRIL